MTTTVDDRFDAIGQKIIPGDYVISIRDGTGARPRLVIKFSASKVRVSSSWGTDSSLMDSVSLVVITTNMQALHDAGDQTAIDTMKRLQDDHGSAVDHNIATNTKPPSPRWFVVSYSADGTWGSAPVQYVSVHHVMGTTNESLNEVVEEAHTLGKTSGVDTKWTMMREASGGYYSHQPYWSRMGSAKDNLLSAKSMKEVGLENVQLNVLIPLDTFNQMIPPTHRIENK